MEGGYQRWDGSSHKSGVVGGGTKDERGTGWGLGGESARVSQAAIASQLLPRPHFTLPFLPTLSLLVPTPIWTWHHSL